MNPLYKTISPAYGRNYENATIAIFAFNKGVDFSLGTGGGPYISIRDYAAGDEVSIRFNRLQDKVVVRIDPDVGNAVEVK